MEPLGRSLFGGVSYTQRGGHETWALPHPCSPTPKLRVLSALCPFTQSRGLGSFLGSLTLQAYARLDFLLENLC